MKTYRATFEKDETGYWAVVVQVDKKTSAISDGQTLPKARKRVRDAVALLLDIKPDAFELDEVIELPGKAKKAIAGLADAKELARKADAQLASARLKAATELVAAGLSRRDAGDILGVSGMRVQQMLG
jgi:predicted RNase H-like HicB family nuclease